MQRLVRAQPRKRRDALCVCVECGEKKALMHFLFYANGFTADICRRCNRDIVWRLARAKKPAPVQRSEPVPAVIQGSDFEDTPLGQWPARRPRIAQ